MLALIIRQGEMQWIGARFGGRGCRLAALLEKNMQKLHRTLPLAAAFLGIATSAEAGVAFSSFGPGETYNSTSALFVNPSFSPAAQFTSGLSGTLSSIRIAMNNNSSSAPSAFTLSLFGVDPTTQGATPVASWNGLSSGQTYFLTPSPVTVAAGGFDLVAGTTYWLRASSPNSLLWNFGTPFGTGAFSVLTAEPVPEPFTMALGAAAACAFLRKRMKAKLGA